MWIGIYVRNVFFFLDFFTIVFFFCLDIMQRKLQFCFRDFIRFIWRQTTHRDLKRRGEENSPDKSSDFPRILCAHVFSHQLPHRSPIPDETIPRLCERRLQQPSMNQRHPKNDNFLKISKQFQLDLSKPPDSAQYALRRFGLGVFYLIVFQALGMIVSDDYLISEDYEKLSFLKRAFLLGVWGRYSLYKYISCWLLAEGGCILFG